jgi:uncharacterized membrane protein YbaN (DUF454 family)
MRKVFWSVVGYVSLFLGALGALLPLLPTVPFLILSAFCFAQSNPALERWLLQHPRYGTSIRLWRERGAISRAGKHAALLAFCLTLGVSFLVVSYPWSMAPIVPLVVIGTWIWTRPEN